MDVTQILLSAQSANAQTRTHAERVLKEAEESNPGLYLTTLVDHLAGEENDPESRRLAGLIIKNAIYTRDPAIKHHLHERWVRSIDENAKAHIRSNLLRALAARAPEPRRAAAQVIAKVAAMDVARGAWDSLISDLLRSASSLEDHVKQASLEALGYTCEEAGIGDRLDDVLSTQSNQILTAVVQGMAYPGGSGSSEQSARLVRLAATNALNNTLEFARAQFEIPAERAAIVNTICEAAKSGDVQVRQAAFEGLVKVAENYYEKLSEYIRDIYTLTENAIRNDVEPVAMQAIEFWSTVAEEEVSILYDGEAVDPTRSPVRKSEEFVKHALPYLCGPIFDSLKKQEDDPLEDSSWNIATAAGACIELLAQAAPNTVLGLVQPFIESNIRDQANWRSREAAILVFGSVLEGPPEVEIRNLVREAISVLIETLVRDPNLAVKDTTAWTIARVVLVDRSTTLSNLKALVECLKCSLMAAENPDLAAHICYAIHNIAERFYDEHEEESGPLTEHFQPLFACLMQTADRDDAGDSNLRISAYETINALFRSVTRDALPFIASCVPMLRDKLEAALNAVPRALSEVEQMDTIEKVGLVCGALTTATHRLTMEQVVPHADQLMRDYLNVFQVPGSEASLEDAFLAVGALAHVLGKEFNRYMSHFMPYLQQALGNLQAHQMVGVSVGVAGEICRGLGKGLIPYANTIVSLLLEALKSPTLNRTVKPGIMGCFGDIAMSVKGHFETYLKPVMDCMKQAAESSVQLEIVPDDYDTIEWVVALREAILESYTGIVSGLKDDNKQENLHPHLDWILGFCEVMVTEGSHTLVPTSEVMLRDIMGLMGDIVDAVPQFQPVAKQKAWLQALVERGSGSADERTSEIATLAYYAIFRS
ncbi:Importin beta [Gracilaria domingensis]|nr:Importin beta [Gracilaria domingensis]